MTNPELSNNIALSTDDSSYARLSAPWLTITRATWIVLITGMVLLFVAGLLVGFGQLHTVCTGELCHPAQLSPIEANLNEQLGLSLDFYAWYTTITFGVFGSVLFVVGALIFWRRSDDRMALFVSLFLVMFGADALPVISSLEMIQPQVVWARNLTFLLGGSLPAVLALFPDGRFVPRWIRWMVLMWLVFMVMNLLAKPLPRGGIMSGPPSSISLGMMLAGGYAQVYRYRRVSTPLQRQQTKWAMLGFVGHLVCLLVLVSAMAFSPALTRPGLPNLILEKYAFAFVGLLPILFIPVTIAISILRYRLWDIDMIINRTLVYGLLTAIIVGIYVVIVGSAGTLLQTGSSLPVSLFATGVVAMSFQPIRERLQRAVNRLMFGQRDEPYRILSRLGQQLNTVTAAESLLPTIAETIATALKLPYAAIMTRQHGQYTMQASHGEARTLTHIVPLVYQNERVGQLVVGQRSPGESLTPADQRVLEDIARQMGAVVHAVRLADDLQRSRERLVTAREEERRRLRRDLHDELGPALASQTLKLDAAIDLVETAPKVAIKLLMEMKTQSQSLVADVRRLVYDLRPPALDELGLLAALRARLSQLAPEQSDLTITIEAPGDLPPLSAAVEVAAYRIAQEAITNVIKHARARRCALRLSSVAGGSCLQIEVMDDGVGLPRPVTSGVGLQSMRERAEELGGRYVARRRLAGGTQIRVRLPLRSMEVPA